MLFYYCNLRWTTMDSHELAKKGNMKKNAKCYSRIFYYKKKKNIY